MRVIFMVSPFPSVQLLAPDLPLSKTGTAARFGSACQDFPQWHRISCSAVSGSVSRGRATSQTVKPALVLDEIDQIEYDVEETSSKQGGVNRASRCEEQTRLENLSMNRPPAESVAVPAAALRGFVTSAFERASVPPDKAAFLADLLV